MSLKQSAWIYIKRSFITTRKMHVVHAIDCHKFCNRCNLRGRLGTCTSLQALQHWAIRPTRSQTRAQGTVAHSGSAGDPTVYCTGAGRGRALERTDYDSAEANVCANKHAFCRRGQWRAAPNKAPQSLHRISCIAVFFSASRSSLRACLNRVAVSSFSLHSSMNTAFPFMTTSN